MKRPVSGSVVDGLQVVQLHVFVEVVATVTEGVESTYVTAGNYSAIAVSVVSVFSHLGVSLVNGNDVAEQISSVCVYGAVVYEASQTFTVVQEGQIVCLSA